MEVSEATLRSYDLTLDGVAEAIRRSNLNLAGGTVRNSDREVRIRTIGRRYTGRELGPIIVKAQPDGGVLTLNQIAEIHDGFAEDPLRVEVDGKQAVLLHVFKSKEDDALMISKAVHEFVERRQKELSGLLELGGLCRLHGGFEKPDGPHDQKRSLWCGLSSLSFSCSSWKTRSAVWTGMGVPVSIAGGIALLWLSGGSLNMITLFGFIMVLGIVVDDAIVVNEAVHTHRGMGKDLLRSITDGLQEVGAPVLIAVGTTIIAFVPLYFVQGVLGQYIAIFPIVVIGCPRGIPLRLPLHSSRAPQP